MQKIYFSGLMFTIFLLFAACGGSSTIAPNKADSADSFVASLLNAVKNKDENQIWEHFIHKEELTAMLTIQGTPSETLNSKVDDMWSAMESGKGSQYSAFEKDGITDWSDVQVDSVRLAIIRPRPDERQKVVESAAEGMGTLHVHITTASIQKIMLLPCIKMKSGIIRLVGYPRFKVPEPPAPKPTSEDSLSRWPS